MRRSRRCSRRAGGSRWRRRAAASGWRFCSWPPNAGSGSRRSSASATRPTCRATTCCSTARAIRAPARILLYLESFGNPRRFAQLARRIGRSKPIVVVKAGRTRAGIARGRQPHGRPRVERRRRGRALPPVGRDPRRHHRRDVRHRDVPGPAAAARRAAPRRSSPTPAARHPGRRRVRSGGLTVAEFSRRPRAPRWPRFLPAHSSVGNPVDLVASAGPDEYRRAIEVALAADETDALLVIYTPIDRSQAPADSDGDRRRRRRRRRAGAAEQAGARVHDDRDRAALAAQRGAASIPAFAFPENAVRALGKVAAYARWQAEPPGLPWGFDDVHVGRGAGALPRDRRRARRHLADARGADARAERVRAAARAGARRPAAKTKRPRWRAIVGFPVVLEGRRRRTSCTRPRPARCC